MAFEMRYDQHLQQTNNGISKRFQKTGVVTKKQTYSHTDTMQTMI